MFMETQYMDVYKYRVTTECPKNKGYANWVCKLGMANWVCKQGMYPGYVNSQVN